MENQELNQVRNVIKRFMGGQHYKANVSLSKPFRKSPPAWEQYHVIGARGDFFTRVRCYVHKPTMEHTDTSIFLAMSNGKDRVFSRIQLNELDGLIEALESWKQEISALLPQLQLEEEAIKKGYDAYQEQKKLLDFISNLSEASIDSEHDDEQFIEPEPDS